MEAEFWYHLEHFPHSRNIPDRVIDELMSTIASGSIGAPSFQGACRPLVSCCDITDTMTSRDSTFAYKPEESKMFVDFLEKLHSEFLLHVISCDSL